MFHVNKRETTWQVSGIRIEIDMNDMNPVNTRNFPECSMLVLRTTTPGPHRVSS